MVHIDGALFGRRIVRLRRPGPFSGVAAGHIVLNEPPVPAFTVAVALMVGDLLLVNRPR